MKSYPLLAAADLASFSPAFVLDVRDRSTYEEGHWPNASHLDIKQWEYLARTAEGALEQIDAWEAQIGGLGIDGRMPVIVYDDGRMTEAARTWFILQWHGVDARVLDGGWPALSREPHWVPEQAPYLREPVSYHRPSTHVPTVGLIDRQSLLERLGQGVQVLDARTQGEYLGEDLRSNARGGHLPGAKWLAHAELLNSDGTLRSKEELQARMSVAGLEDGAPIVTHCDAGGRAALAAIAAVVAGQSGVHAYYLSFSDWASDGACPIVKP
jgi:thiosulfate/3-mercaptopyruvate sulfurtransferase